MPYTRKTIAQFLISSGADPHTDLPEYQDILSDFIKKTTNVVPPSNTQYSSPKIKPDTPLVVPKISESKSKPKTSPKIQQTTNQTFSTPQPSLTQTPTTPTRTSTNKTSATPTQYNTYSTTDSYYPNNRNSQSYTPPAPRNEVNTFFSLIIACQEGDLKTVRKIVKTGININGMTSVSFHFDF